MNKKLSNILIDTLNKLDKDDLCYILEKISNKIPRYFLENELANKLNIEKHFIIRLKDLIIHYGYYLVIVNNKSGNKLSDFTKDELNSFVEIDKVYLSEKNDVIHQVLEGHFVL